MKKKLAFLLTLCTTIVLLFPWDFINCEQKNGLDFILTSPLLSQIKDGDSIVGVRTFLTLFVWKSKLAEIADLTKLALFETNDERRNYTNEIIRKNNLSIAIIPDHEKYLTSFFALANIPLNQGAGKPLQSSSYFYMYPQVDMCQRRNYFRRYDAILLDPYYFSYFVRFYRDVDMPKDTYMNSNDFIAIPLIPYEVYTHSSANLVSSLFDLEETSCEERPDISDAQYFRKLTGYANFSQTDVNIIQAITGKLQIVGNWSLVNHHLPPLNSTISVQTMLPRLLPSTCYMCQSVGCFGENFDPVLDYWIIPQFLIVVTYFLLFFGLKIYKKPSMKRRIGLPYCSIHILVIMVTFTGLSRTCVGFWFSVCVFFLFWFILIYMSTILRFYYLRNLYALILRFPNKEKMLKVLASQKVGFLLTVVLTVPLSLVLNSVSIYFFVNEDKVKSDIFRPIIGLILFVGLWICGGLSVLWDVLLQRKSILKDGIRKFFFFDDPFYLRLDLLATIIPVIIVIVTAVENSVVSSVQQDLIQVLYVLTGVFNTLLCLSFTQISGGNVLFIEIYKMVTKKKEIEDLNTVNQLENPDLLCILKEYCEKEFSSENYELFMKLKSFKNKKMIKFKELQEIESEFLRNYSKYEVNIPSTCKRHFYELLRKCEEETQIEFDLVWKCLETDLMLNLQDTFKRLQETSTYTKWKSIQSLQHLHHI